MPSFTPIEKQLAAPVLSGTGATSLYAPAANTVGVVESLTITNVSASSAKAKLFYDDGKAGTKDETTALLWNLELQPGETEHLGPNLLCLPLGSNDELFCQADNASRLLFTCSGGEVTSTDYTEVVEGFLGKSRPVADTETQIFSPSVSVDSVEVRLIVCCNVGANDETFRIYLDHDGSTYSNLTALFWDIEIPPGSSEFLKGRWGMADGSGNLAARANTNNNINFMAFGTQYDSAS